MLVFLIAEVLRDFWLAAPYAAGWFFLFSGTTISTWIVVLMIGFYFIIVWGALVRPLFSVGTPLNQLTSLRSPQLTALIVISRTHAWFLTIFGLGLLAPRWAQCLWGASGLGLYFPIFSKAGPFAAIALWLWLGVLDSIQGIAIGFLLLQTLSRVHVTATLAIAQILGSITVAIGECCTAVRMMWTVANLL